MQQHLQQLDQRAAAPPALRLEGRYRRGIARLAARHGFENIATGAGPLEAVRNGPEAREILDALRLRHRDLGQAVILQDASARHVARLRLALAPLFLLWFGLGIWSKVALTGRYLHDKTAYVRSSRPEPKPGERDSQGRKLAPGSFGVFVLTPFVTRLCDSAGACKLTTLYVNRGFVPTPPDGRIPVYDRLDDPVSITGFLRPSEKPGLFQPGNDPAKGTYFTRSIEEMAKAAGIFRADENPSPYARFLDRQADENESAPPYGIAIADFLKAIPDNHTEYAITWWSLAAVNILFLGIFLISRRRQDAEAR